MQDEVGDRSGHRAAAGRLTHRPASATQRRSSRLFGARVDPLRHVRHPRGFFNTLLRDEWFDRLSAMGLDDPWEEDRERIPQEFLSDANTEIETNVFES